MFFGRLKNYFNKDEQTDIFGEQHTSYVNALHQKSHKQYLSLVPLGLEYVAKRMLRKKLSFEGRAFEDLTLAIDPMQGRFLYAQVLTKKPSCIVEFGTSFGVSSLYMAKALKELGRGHFIGCEIESSKVQKALEHFKHCELDDWITLLEGDICETLKDFNRTIDMVHMDGFPELNLKVLQTIEPFLDQNCLIITDDSILFGLEMEDYLDYLKGSSEYCHQTLNLSTGISYSVKKTPACYLTERAP